MCHLTSSSPTCMWSGQIGIGLARGHGSANAFSARVLRGGKMSGLTSVSVRICGGTIRFRRFRSLGAFRSMMKAGPLVASCLRYCKLRSLVLMYAILACDLPRLRVRSVCSVHVGMLVELSRRTILSADKKNHVLRACVCAFAVAINPTVINASVFPCCYCRCHVVSILD